MQIQIDFYQTIGIIPHQSEGLCSSLNLDFVLAVTKYEQMYENLKRVQENLSIIISGTERHVFRYKHQR
jgi:hypothetical protein